MNCKPYTLILIIAAIFLSCKSETKSKKDIENPFIQYSSIREMLEESGDFYEENGSLKFLSEEKSKIHVQISKPISKNDLESIKQEIVQRDIVYVAFQAFAQTDLDELTITSIPSDIENSKKYYDEYKITVKVHRTKAESILKDHLNSDNFSILFDYKNGIWLPNKNFDKLKFKELQTVFNKLANN